LFRPTAVAASMSSSFPSSTPAKSVLPQGKDAPASVQTPLSDVDVWLGGHLTYGFKIYRGGDSVEALTRASQQEPTPYRQAVAPLRQAQKLALGDIHASWQTLLETMIAAGMVSVPLESMKALYATGSVLDSLAAKDRFFDSPASRQKALTLFQTFKAHLPRVTWTGGDRQLVLVGDVTADRGPADLFTLMLMDRLRRQKAEGSPPFEVTFSNHDARALKWFQADYHKDEPLHDRFMHDDALRKRHWGSYIRTLRMVMEDPSLKPLVMRLYRQHFQHLSLCQWFNEERVLVLHAPTTRPLSDAVLSALRRPVDTSFSKEAVMAGQLSESFHQLNGAFTSRWMAPKLQDGTKDFVSMQDPILEFVKERANPARMASFPFTNHHLRYLVHGHALDEEINDGNGRILWRKPLHDVEPSTMPGQEEPIVRIGLNNRVRYDEKGYYTPVKGGPKDPHNAAKVFIIA
jgi:hypothetical protein